MAASTNPAFEAQHPRGDGARFVDKEHSAPIAGLDANGLSGSGGEEYLIRATDGASGFWSNEFGWTGVDDADHFTPDEREELNLPLGGEWVRFDPEEHAPGQFGQFDTDDDLDEMGRSLNPNRRAYAAGHPGTPLEVLHQLLVDPDPEVRGALAGNPSAPGYALPVLMRDDDPEVRKAAAEQYEDWGVQQEYPGGGWLVRRRSPSRGDYDGATVFWTGRPRGVYVGYASAEAAEAVARDLNASGNTTGYSE